MNLLAFDTSTERLSLALSRGDRQWQHSGAGGAQASASLIPALQQLMGQAGLAWHQLDAIVFGRGPGSFTGLRTACSVAQGLGLGAAVPLLPVDTLLAVAQDARERHGLEAVVAWLDARMDEVYSATYRWQSGWQTEAAPQLGRPEALHLPSGWALAGNTPALYATRLPEAAISVEAWPTALAMLQLAPELLAAGQAVPAEQALPLYLRDKVAQTTAEREALKQATASHTP